MCFLFIKSGIMSSYYNRIINVHLKMNDVPFTRLEKSRPHVRFVVLVAEKLGLTSLLVMK